MTDESPPRPRGRRIRVLWNPGSGRKAGIPTNNASRASLEELMTRHDLGHELVETASEEDALDRTRDAVAAGYDVVVAAGGDGSIGLVAGALLESQTALGMLPLGSIMNIPRMLDVPRDLDAAAGILASGHVRTIDVGVSGTTLFYEAASVGLHAAVFRDIAEVDEGHYSAIFRSIAAAFRYRPTRMVVELDDGHQVATRALLVAVANGRFMGPGLTVAPDAILDDGMFDVRIFEHYSKWELLRHLASIAFGRRAYAPRVRTERAASVRISGARPLPARADAIDLGVTPVAFRTRAGVLRVVAPRPGDIDPG